MNIKELNRFGSCSRDEITLIIKNRIANIREYSRALNDKEVLKYKAVAAELRLKKAVSKMEIKNLMAYRRMFKRYNVKHLRELEGAIKT